MTRRRYRTRQNVRTEMTHTARLLRQVLIDIGEHVPANMQIERLFPGCNQRAMGAWLFATFDGGNLSRIWEIGSCYTATAIIKAHHTSGYEVSTEITPGGVEIFVDRFARYVRKVKR